MRMSSSDRCFLAFCSPVGLELMRKPRQKGLVAAERGPGRSALPATGSRRARLGVVRRLLLRLSLPRSTIPQVRSNGIRTFQLFNQIRELHLAVRIGVLKRLPPVAQLLQPAERHRAE